MTTMTGRTAQAALLTTLAAHNRPVVHPAGPTAFSQPSSGAVLRELSGQAARDWPIILTTFATESNA